MIFKMEQITKRETKKDISVQAETLPLSLPTAITDDLKKVRLCLDVAVNVVWPSVPNQLKHAV